jgi:L-asparaginase
MPDSHFPRIAVVGCGGTISSLGTSNLDVMDYPDKGRKLSAAELVARVPELERVAEVVPVPFRDVSSSALTVTDWLELRGIMHDLCGSGRGVDGIVIPHGTGTLEETAFFLHLTAEVDQPVVLVGAQRPLSALSSDAPMNLFNAVRVAGDRASRGRGVLVMLNDEIHSARDVVKTSNYRLQTFRSLDFGMLGHVDGDGVHFFRTIDRKHTRSSPFARLAPSAVFPRIDIIYAHVGGDDLFINAAKDAGAAGLVSAGFAPGLMPPVAKAALEALASTGFPIVLCSRAASGRVVERRYVREKYMIAGGDFSPQKARIVLMLCLAHGFDIAQIRHVFSEI